jgi:hypothetical protein
MNAILKTPPTHHSRPGVLLALALLASGLSQATTAIARAERTVRGTDTARLHLTRVNENLLYEEGAAYGDLPGHMRAEMHVGNNTLSGTCTIYTHDGWITGRGTAIPHGAGRYQSFRGSLTITSGSGRYMHIHGRAGLYGTFDRRTYAMVVQTTGTLSY